MKRALDPAQRPSLGSIHPDGVLPLCEVGRRTGWASRMTADVQRLGLRTCTIGRMKYTTGAAVLAFVEAIMGQQANRAAGSAAGNDSGQRGRADG